MSAAADDSRASFAAALTSACLRRPASVLALGALAVLLLGAGALRLRSEAGYRAFLGAGHPVLRELDAFLERFGGGLPFAAVWSCERSPACESVFDAASLGMAHAVARALEAEPGVRRVDSPATSPLLVPVLFELPEARRLAPDGAPAPDLAELAERARADPTWAGQIVSADGRAGAILVHLASSDPALGERALRRLRALLAPFEARGFAFDLVGGPVEFVVAGEELARDAARVVPLMVLLVAIVLALLFRSASAALVSLASVGVAVLATRGVQGWLGWPDTSLTQVLPPLVLVIGTCDAMHVVASYATRLSRRAGTGRAEREAVLAEVARDLGRPCALTSLTTAAGFASFAVSGLESFAHLGALAAFGVMAALFCCFSLLPIALARMPPGRLLAAPALRAWSRSVEAIVGLGVRRPFGVLAVALALALLGAAGASQLRVDASFEDLYGAESQVVRWVRGAAESLRGAETLEIALEAPAGTELHAPAALRVVEEVEALEGIEGLGAPLSILAPLRQLHGLVHGSPLALDEPDAAERTRGLLRLLRFEDPELVAILVAESPPAWRVSLQAGKLPQAELRRVLAQVRARVDAALPEGWHASVTGPLAVVAAMIDEIRATQLESFALAGALVLAMIAVGLRSLRAGLLAVVPTALPILLSLGAMGWLGVPLDVGTAMVAAVVLGLAVDDAIHLIAAIERARGRGAARQAALVEGAREVGRALVTTSLALAAGFLSIGLAPWRSIASFGLVAALAILAALAAVLIVVPALLVAPGARLQKP